MASVMVALAFGFEWGMTAWWVSLLTLAWMLIRRPGERFRDFIVRMSFRGDFYDKFRGADRP